MGVMLKHPSHDRVHSKHECVEFEQATGVDLLPFEALEPCRSIHCRAASYDISLHGYSRSSPA